MRGMSRMPACLCTLLMSTATTRNRAAAANFNCIPTSLTTLMLPQPHAHLLSHLPFPPGLPPRYRLLPRQPLQNVGTKPLQRALPVEAACGGMWRWQAIIRVTAGLHLRNLQRNAARPPGRSWLRTHRVLNRPDRLMILGTSWWRAANITALMPPLLQRGGKGK